MENIETGQNKERFDYIDIIRIIACLFVIYNHTNNRGFNWYQNVQNIPAIWIWDTALAILSKMGVPLFFMISGAMLLEKSEDIRRTYKRIPRILFDLVIFSAFYQILNRIHEGMDLSVVDIVKGIISTSIWHMWFLYAYLAFLITLPIMSQMIKGIDKEHFRLMLLIMIVLDGILPVIEFFTVPIEASIKPSWIITSIFMYPLIGYYIDKASDTGKIKKNRFYSCGQHS